MKETNTFEIIGMLTVLIVTIFALYIMMVLEPACEEKGFAGASSQGCYIIKDGVKTFEQSK